MKVAFVLALAVTFIGGKLSLPVGQEKTGQELATRCVVEVLSKALSKANAPPVHPQCRDFLRAGLKHETEKKREEETAPFEGTRSQEQDEVRRQAEVTNIRGGDTEEAEYAENFLKALQEKEHHLQSEGSQETITSSEEKRSTDHHTDDDDDEDGASKHSHQSDEVVREVSDHSDLRSTEHSEKWGDQEKRSDTEDNDENTREIWGPAHGYHQNKHKRSGDSFEEGASEESEEIETEDREKRIWKPTHRYHHKKHKRSGDSSEDEASEESEETEDREKRIWKPTHRYHHKKHRRSGDSSEDEASEESEETEDREKRLRKPTHRYHHKKHRRSGDSFEDEASEESEETEDREKRLWKPTHRYHHKKHRRSGDSYEDEASEEETEDRGKRLWKPTHRYHHKKHRKSGDSSEDEHYIDPEEDEDEEKQVWNLAHEVQDLKHKRKRGSSEEEDQDLLSVQERNHEFSEDDEAKAKRIWRPTHTYHPNKQRKGDSSEEEDRRNLPDESEADERKEPYYSRKKKDQSSEMLEDVYKRHDLKVDEDPSKRHYHLEERRYTYGDEMPHHDESDKDEGKELQEDKTKVLRYLVERGDGAEGQSEEEEERSPWEEQEYHHPAWWKRSPARGEMEEGNQADLDWWGGRQAAVETYPHHLQETRPHLSSEMVELAKLLNYKKAEVPGILQSQRSRSLHQRPLTPEEEKELENLAAMDIELQKIAEKIHEKERE